MNQNRTCVPDTDCCLRSPAWGTRLAPAPCATGSLARKPRAPRAAASSGPQRALGEWLLGLGHQPLGVELHQHGGGFAAFATQPIGLDAVIVSVPARALLTPRHALRTLPGAGTLSEWQALLWAMLWEARLGAARCTARCIEFIHFNIKK